MPWRNFCVSFSVVLLLVTSSFTQSEFPEIFSPTQGETFGVPIVDVEYFSIRQRSLGKLLHPISDDTLTGLFRNPATLIDLQGNLFLVDIQNRSSSPSPPPIQPFTPLHVTGQLQNFAGIKPHYNLGFWSPAFPGLNLPAGLFISVVRQENKSEDYDQDSSSSSISVNEYISSSRRNSPITEVNTKLWLGVYHTSRLRLGLSYTFFFNKNPDELHETSQRITKYANEWTQDYDSREKNNKIEHRMHKVTLAAVYARTNWQWEPGLSFYKYSARRPIDDILNSRSMRYPPGFPDSLFSLNTFYRTTQQMFDWDVTALSGNLRVRHKNWSGFFSITWGNVDQDEDKFSGSFQKSFRSDTLFQIDSTFQNRLFQGSESGFLTLHGALGKKTALSAEVNLFSLLAVSYFRHQLQGDYLFRDYSQKGYVPNISVIDTSLTSLKQYRSYSFVFSLPVGIEGRLSRFQLRGGIVWNYTLTSDREYFGTHLREGPEYREDTKSNISRDEFFGAGFRWKNFQLDIFAGTSLWELNQWSVSLLYQL